MIKSAFVSFYNRPLILRNTSFRYCVPNSHRWVSGKKRTIRQVVMTISTTQHPKVAASGPIELSDEVKQTIKSTVPVLKSHGLDIVQRFYTILFERYPHFKQYFNMDRHAKGKTKTDGAPAQAVALARAVLAYAQNIDSLDVLGRTVNSICHKHVSRGIEPLQYDAIGECLIDAIAQTIGDAATPPIVNAWKKAYQFLAHLFIITEQQIYAKAAQDAGYEGFTKMNVLYVQVRDDGSKVLAVLPTNGIIPNAKTGQYVSISVSNVPEYGTTMLTANVEEESDHHLCLVVPNNGEAANTHLLDIIDTTSVLTVGMPCGLF